MIKNLVYDDDPTGWQTYCGFHDRSQPQEGFPFHDVVS